MLLLESSGFIGTQLNSKIAPSMYIASILFVALGLTVVILMKLRPDIKRIFLVADEIIVFLGMFTFFLGVPALENWPSAKLFLSMGAFIGSMLVNFVMVAWAAYR